jgi:hypothetical protein
VLHLSLPTQGRERRWMKGGRGRRRIKIKGSRRMIGGERITIRMRRGRGREG